MSVTIIDVAKEAKVSISTVSRVLNNKDIVKPKTRIKVENAIKKLNFDPDFTAQTMISKKTRTIGLIIPTLYNEYWSILSAIVQEHLWEFGYMVILCNTNNDKKKKEAYIQMLLKRKVDGVILCEFKENKEIIESLLRHNIPTVALQVKIDGIDSVYGNQLQGSMDAVNHLIQLGHSKIAYIGLDDLMDNRELGYRNALMINGIPVDENLIIKGQFTTNFGFQAAESLINRKLKFESIFCWNDIVAFGVIQALQLHHFDVPKDVTLIGFDDIQMIQFIKPSLTTIKQPLQEMCSAAAQLLLEKIDGKENNSKTPRDIVFPTRLVIRESCGSKLR